MTLSTKRLRDAVRAVYVLSPIMILTPGNSVSTGGDTNVALIPSVFNASTRAFAASFVLPETPLISTSPRENAFPIFVVCGPYATKLPSNQLTGFHPAPSRHSPISWAIPIWSPPLISTDRANSTGPNFLNSKTMRSIDSPDNLRGDSRVSSAMIFDCCSLISSNWLPLTISSEIKRAKLKATSATTPHITSLWETRRFQVFAAADSQTMPAATAPAAIPSQTSNAKFKANTPGSALTIAVICAHIVAIIGVLAAFSAATWDLIRALRR